MFGLLDSFRGLGGLLGPILAGTLVTAYGYRLMFLVMAAMSALALVLSIPGTRNSSPVSASPHETAKAIDSPTQSN